MSEPDAFRRINYEPVKVVPIKRLSSRATQIAEVLMGHLSLTKGRYTQRDLNQRAMMLGRLNSIDASTKLTITREVVDTAEAVIGDWIIGGDERSPLELMGQAAQLGLDYPEPRKEIA